MFTSEYALREQRRSAILSGLAGKPGSDSAAASTADEVELTAVAEQADPRDFSALAIVELLLKDRWRLYRLLRVPSAPSLLLPRLLAISLAGYVLFGVTMAIVMSSAGTWPALTSIADWLDSPTNFPLTFERTGGPFAGASLGRGPALTLAYAFGLVAASCVCLPSLYFYCLLAGVRMTMLEVVVHAVKSKAIAAVALVGILPIYVALAMGVAIFGASEAAVKTTMVLGLMLPFIAGLWGTVAIYQAFSLLCDTLPPHRMERRACFLRRLVLSWSAIYTAVMPVMIYSVWEVLSRVG